VEPHLDGCGLWVEPRLDGRGLGVELRLDGRRLFVEPRLDGRGLSAQAVIICRALMMIGTIHKVRLNALLRCFTGPRLSHDVMVIRW